MGMLVLTVYRNLFMELLISFLAAGPWFGLIVKGAISFLIGGITLYIYAGLAQSIGIF